VDFSGFFWIFVLFYDDNLYEDGSYNISKGFA